MAVTVWLAHWSQKRPGEQERPYYVIVLAAFTAAAVVLSLLRAILAFYSMVKVKKRGGSTLTRSVAGVEASIV